MEIKKGCYLAIEGPDANGKSTQAKHLYHKLDEAFPGQVIHVIEPGGTVVGQEIRGIILSNRDLPSHQKVNPRCELLLFSANRAQLVDEKIKPAIQQGKIVLTERYFLSSQMYQGVALGLSMEAINEITNFAVQGCEPDQTFVLDIPVEESKRRLIARGTPMDVIEQRPPEFHEAVRRGYIRRAGAIPEKVTLLDGCQPVDMIHEQIWSGVADFLLATDRISPADHLQLRNHRS